MRAVGWGSRGKGQEQGRQRWRRWRWQQCHGSHSPKPRSLILAILQQQLLLPLLLLVKLGPPVAPHWLGRLLLLLHGRRAVFNILGRFLVLVGSPVFPGGSHGGSRQEHKQAVVNCQGAGCYDRSETLGSRYAHEFWGQRRWLHAVAARHAAGRALLWNGGASLHHTGSAAWDERASEASCSSVTQLQIRRGTHAAC